MSLTGKNIRSFLLALFLLFSVGLAGAGVVDDAEEELKKLRRDQGVTEAESRGDRPAFPSTAGYDRPASSTSVGGRSSSGPGSKTGGSPGVESRDSGKTAPLPQEEREEEPRPPRQARERADKDRLYSILGLFFLLSLILGAVLLSRQSGTGD